MNVLKFGGTSMGDEHTWRRVLDIISPYQKPVIVVSATARTTRQLIAAAEKALTDSQEGIKIAESIRERHQSLIQNFLSEYSDSDAETEQIFNNCTLWIDRCIKDLNDLLQKISSQKNISPSRQDAIASIGEQLSAYLFAQCGKAYGLSTCWVDAREIIKTDSSFGQANPHLEAISQSAHGLREKLEQGFLPVIGGFYGEDQHGAITTLGFEGSDYTASLVGSSLQAQSIEIWTDVSGIYTCDPNVVEEARSIPELSFQEATELAYFGAKVLHPSTMKPAAAAGIPLFVKNIFEPDHTGTKIHDGQSRHGWAKALTYLKNIVILTVTANKSAEGHQFLADVFRILNDAQLPVNAVTTTEASVSVALNDHDRVATVKDTLQKIGSVDLVKNQGLVSLIGCTFEEIETIQERVLTGISDITPTLVSYSKAKKNLNIAVNVTELIPAVCRIHHSLFEKNR